MLEEAKKRDHRKIGKEMELFMFSDRVGKGLPIWCGKGRALRLCQPKGPQLVGQGSPDKQPLPDRQGSPDLQQLCPRHRPPQMHPKRTPGQAAAEPARLARRGLSGQPNKPWCQPGQRKVQQRVSGFDLLGLVVPLEPNGGATQGELASKG